MSQSGFFIQGSHPSKPIETITGDVGGAIGPDGAGNTNLLGGTSGAVFTGAGNTITESFNFLYLPATTASNGQILINGNPILQAIGTNNIFLGASAGNFTLTQTGSTGIGVSALNNLTTTGTNNVALGYQAGMSLLTGGSNVLLGATAGSAYVGAESGNIAINAAGVAAESNTTRIGTSQTRFFAKGISGVTPATAGALVTITDSAGQMGTIAAGTNGQVIIGSTGANPTFATLTSSGGTITFTPGAGTLNLEAAGGSFPGGVTAWENDTTTPIALVANHGYSANRAAGVTYTLPAVAAQFTVIRIVGIQGSWTITQAANQEIFVGNTHTTTGVGGSLASSDAGDCVELLCITANLLWRAISIVGNLTVV
jgi:hypothetical protein